MRKTPINTFKNKEEFLETCNYWKDKLFLNDWMIKFELLDTVISDKENYDDAELLGECSFSFINRQAFIQIDNKHCCAELTLVHELLHLTTPFISDDNLEPNESVKSNNTFKDAIIHQCLDQFAKSLILVRYSNINKTYFLRELDEL